ncbi:hypothetical protein HHI36_010921 [Cryptolaemus montrouzieri]|uniref:Allorecognition 2 n=1 Tax=Cryptolaemus montrouzieri TaxID=559131 RepID=A0ABD2MKA9_9CUCU
MPNLDYTMKIRAQTAVGLGRYSRPKIITTNAKASDPVREMEIAITEAIISNETYKLKVQLAFKEPCNTNGPFEYYSIKYDDEFTYQIRDHYLTLKEFTLSRPDYNYIFEIRVKTESFESSITRKSILTDAGVPLCTLTK